MTALRFLPRFRQAYRLFDELEAREKWPRNEIESFQLQRLNDVWQHAIRHVPYYRGLHAQRSLPDRFESLGHFTSEVPLLDKTLVRADRTAFLSDQARPGRWHRTSGSTGIPLLAFRARDAHLEMLRTNYRYYRMWGHDIFDRMVFLWDLADARGTGLKTRFKRGVQFVEDTLRNRLRLPTHDLSPEALHGYLKKIEAFQPSALYAFSRAAYLLALQAKAEKFHCPSLKVVNLTSEPASTHLRRVVEDAFGAPTIVQYGCVELGFMAGTWPDGTCRVREDIVYIETLPRSDGRFDLALTNLNNPSFPLLRYSIGDVTDDPLELPEQGFAILGNITGRCDDLLYSPSGICIHPAAIETVFEYEYSERVRRFQVRQKADGSLLALVELNEAAGGLDANRLAARLSGLIGYPARVEIVPEIRQTEAGKHRIVVCEMKNPLPELAVQNS